MSRPVIALLSAVQPVRADHHVPRALQPFLGAPLILQQLSALSAIGIRRALIACEQPYPALLKAVERGREAGMSIDLVARPADLADHAGEADFILMLADGLLCDHDLLKGLAAVEQPFIAVADDHVLPSSHERIDMNHLWAGIAKIPTHILSTVTQLPDDWNIESALLRHSVQADLPRQRISDQLAAAGAVHIPLDRDELHEFARSVTRLQAPADEGLSERILLRPLSRLALPSLMQHRAILPWLWPSPWIFAILALISSYLGWLVPTCLLALLALFSDHLTRSMANLIPFHTIWKDQRHAMEALLLLALVMRSFHDGQHWPIQPLGLVMLAGLLKLAEYRRPSGGSALWAPDPPMVLLLLLVAAPFAAFTYMLWGLTLLQLALLINDARTARGGVTAQAGPLG